MASGSADAAVRCTNCGSEATLLYCPHCGQRQQPPDLSLRGLLQQLIGELVNVDGRMRRTTASLLLRPGAFALDYFEGRRMRHLPPIRVYLISTLLLFLVLPIFDRPLAVGSTAGSESEDARAHMSDWHIETGYADFDRVLNARLQTQVTHLFAAPDRLGQAVLELAPQIGLFLLPLLALLLYALFWTRGYRYGHHLIAALSLQSGASLLIVVGASLLGLSGLVSLAGLTRTAGAIAWPVGFMPLLLLAYFAAGLRRIYGGRWISTLPRMLALGSVYAVFVLIAFAITLAIAFFNI